MATPYRISIGVSIDASGAKSGAATAEQAVSAIGQEAQRVAPQIEKVTQAVEKLSTKSANSNNAKASIEGIGTAAVAARPTMDHLVSSFARLNNEAVKLNASDYRGLIGLNAELDKLKAKYDPLFAAQLRFEQGLQDIERAERLGLVTASAAIDLRIREKNTYDGLADSLGRVASLRKQSVEQSVAGISVTPDRGADIAAYGQQLDALRAKYNPVFRVLSEYRTWLAQIRTDQKNGAISMDEMTAAISRQRQATLAQVSMLKGRDPLGGGTSAANDQFRRQNLMYQVFDVGQTAFMGMNPLMIFAQQGPQIAQMYAGQGGVNAALKDLGTLATGAAKAITPLTVSIAALASGVAVGALAYSSYLTSIKEVETAASGLGRATAGSADEMERSAAAGAEAANISVASARSMQAQFLRTGRIGSENFEQLIGISKDFGATIGVTADEAGAALADMFSDPAKAAQTLHQQYGLITAATARQATALAQQNRQSDAQALLLKALPGQLADAARATTLLGRAWQNAGTFASNTLNAIGEGLDTAISGSAGQARIDELRRSLAQPRNRQRAAQEQELQELLAAQARERDNQETQALRRRAGATLGLSEQSGANSGALQIERLRNELEGLRADRAAIGSNPERAGLDSTQVGRIDTAIEAKTRALDALINKQQISADLDRLDIQIQNERNPVVRADLEARRTRLQLSSEEISTTRLNAEAEAARNRVIQSTIASAASQAQDMEAEFDIRSRLNGLVASGSITSTDANRLLQEELTLRPLIAAAATAEGDAKTELLRQIEALRGAYAGLAEQEKLSGGLDYLRSQNDRLEQLRVEQGLIGANGAAREKAMALLQAEQTIRQRGIDTNSSLAKQIRENASATAELNSQIERQAEAWSNVQRAAEGAIDGAVDKLSDGDFKGALDEIKDSLLGFVKDDIKANLKNGLLGTDYGTSADLGGFTGIVSRLFGGGNKTDPASIVSKAMGQSVGSMSVSAGTVMINGGVGAGLGGLFPGANDNSNILSFPGGGSISAYASAIKSIESAGSGGYGALGPITASGDRAYGAYQIMGANVPSWTKSALGYSMSPQQFLGDQSAQDAVFEKIFGGYVNKYGASGAAQAWFGGEGSVGRGGVADMLGTTGSAYVEKFNKALGSATASTDVAAQGLGNLGNGFNQFGNSLSQFQPSASGGGGGLFGWIGNLFGGSQWSKAASGQIVGLFSDGGYTGPGGINEPRGVVHAGEVVWSQRDVARVGGVAAAEAMRLGRRGYATGGAVASIPYPVAVNNNSNHQAETQRPKIEIHDYAGVKVEAEETTDERGGRTTRFVISEKVAEALSMPGGAAKRTMNKQFGVQQRRPRR